MSVALKAQTTKERSGTNLPGKQAYQMQLKIKHDS